MERLEALLEQALAIIQAEFGDELLGVLATGSFIHGTPGPTSDLDMQVLIKGVRRRRKNIVIDGMELELFINPPFQVPRYFDEGPATMHMVSFGRAIYDPQGIVAELQAQARARWEAGPPPTPAHELWRQRYMPADLLRDLEDVAGDEASANLVIARTIEALLETHYRHNRRWLAKPKRRLSELEGWDPGAAVLARAALTASQLPARSAALRRLAEHVLAPLGGLMPLAWESDWEAMQP